MGRSLGTPLARVTPHVPGALHQTLVRIFENDPGLLRALLGSELAFPPGELSPLPADVTDFGPSQLLADVVVGIPGPDAPRAIAVVEVQLQRDDAKRLVWPHYATSLWRRFACPVALCVIALDDAVLGWASTPIEYGPGNRFVPLVLGRETIPLVRSRLAARDSPELAVLSALAHRDGPNAAEVAAVALDTLTDVDTDRASIYSDTLIAALPEAARRALEELMPVGKYEYQTEFARKHYQKGLREGLEEGRQEGRREGRQDGRREGRQEGLEAGLARGAVSARRSDLLAILAARGIDVDEALRLRIEAVEDLGTLEAWVVAAAVADSASAVFGK